MRQEAVNTFNKGLVKDLNPLNTPNNVVTDCMNGSFITFNGDEMLLQNDMGNIAIRKNVGTEENPEWEDIHLGEGFIPFGVKEYGGILYIVSGRCSDTITYNNVTIELPEQFNITKDYIAGEYCRYSENNNVYYFIRTAVPDLNHPIPSISEACLTWDVWATDAIGENERTCSHEFKIIETQIGSYPAPETLTLNNAPLVTTTNFSTDELKTSIFTQKLLQDQLLGAGDKMDFSLKNISGDLYTNLSSYNSQGVLQKKLFRFNIYQTLTNGSSLNISDTFTQENLSGDLYFWFNTGSGIDQYIDSRFKGKLAAKLELEKIKQFELSEAWILYQSDSYTYKTKIVVKYESDCLIKINSCILTLNNGANPITVTEVDGAFTFEPVIDNLIGVSSILYTITPIFNYELPQEYIDLYTYSGSLSAEKGIMTVNFINADSLQTVEGATGYRTASIVQIADKDLAPITPSYQKTSTKYAFVLKSDKIRDIAINAGYQIISYFTIDAFNLPKLVDGNGDSITLDNLDLQNKFKAYIVKTQDSLCIPVSTTIYNFYKLTKASANLLDYTNCRAVTTRLKNIRNKYLSDSLYQSITGIPPQYENEYQLIPSTPNPSTIPPNDLVYPAKYKITSPETTYTSGWEYDNLVTVENETAFNKFVISGIKFKFGFVPVQGDGYHLFLITQSNNMFPTYSTEDLITAESTAFQMRYNSVRATHAGITIGSDTNMITTFYPFTQYVINNILSGGLHNFTNMVIYDSNNVAITPIATERIAWLGWQTLSGGTIASLTTNPLYNNGNYTWTSGKFVGTAKHFDSLYNFFLDTTIVTKYLFSGNSISSDFVINIRPNSTPSSSTISGVIFKAHDTLLNPKIT